MNVVYPFGKTEDTFIYLAYLEKKTAVLISEVDFPIINSLPVPGYMDPHRKGAPYDLEYR